MRYITWIIGFVVGFFAVVHFASATINCAGIHIMPTSCGYLDGIDNIQGTVDITLDEDEVGLSITANATQTSDLIEVLDSDGTTGLFSVTGTGQMLAEGSETAPNLSFIGDSDTGWWNITDATALWMFNGAKGFYLNGQTIQLASVGAISFSISVNPLNSGGGKVESAGANTIKAGPKLITGVQSVSCTCSDDPTCGADATAGTLTLEPTSNSVRITNADPNGCDVTMSETNAVDGHMVRISVVSNAGGSVDFAESVGVLEATGNLQLGVYDVLGIEYVSDRWVEAFQSNN